MYYAEITGWGKCVPPAVLSNEDLATFMETTDEWITSRTGIKERRICHCEFSDMAIVSAERALAAADLDPLELDLILLGSLTNDSLCPNTASLIADKLGARNAAAIDINSACTGFLYGLHIGTNLIRTGAHQKILVIGGEFISHYMNWSQRDVAVLFGDACGAAVIEATEQQVGLLTAKIGCESQAKYAIQITVADTRDGACSSSTLKEASSWGKVDVTKEQMVFAEATSVLPLIASDAYHRNKWKDRQRKNFSKIFG